MMAPEPTYEDPGWWATAAVLDDAAERGERWVQSIGGKPLPVNAYTRTGARPLLSVATAAPPPALLGKLDPAGHTILYGAGGVGKGTLAAWWITQLVACGEKVLIVDYEQHPEEWARRIHGLGGDAGAVTYVAPLSATWSGKRGPIWVQADDLRELADEVGATYIVVDSIVVACVGHDPMKPETPPQYTAALELIGRPCLSLAHVPKVGSLSAPFGSVFWHNLARMTWSLEADGETTKLTNRKSNNYQRQRAEVVSVTWMDDLPREVWLAGYSAKLADRIRDVLLDGPARVERIVSALNEDTGDDDERIQVKADSVRAALRRGEGAKPRTFSRKGELWHND